MGSERVDERDIRRIATSRDNDPTYPRHVVARIESPPAPAEEHLYPGAEIHGIDYRYAYVAEMAVDVSRRNVEASAESHREMREIAADAHPFLEGLKRRSGRARLHIVKLDVRMDEIAHSLHASPSGREFAE